MRHRKEKRPLGRTASHRDAMLRNLVTSLIAEGRIVTTLEKAKELRRVADRMVTLGKRGDLAARRRALAVVRSVAVVKKLFTEVALQSETRPGGYTRILHLGNRPGDGARTAIIELVDRPKPEADEVEGKGKAKGGAGAKKPAARKPAAPRPEKPRAEKSRDAKPKKQAGARKPNVQRKAEG